MNDEEVDIGYEYKRSLPNKLIQEDGTVTDMTGAVVENSVEAYDAKQALPNKWLNPDGTYSTLNEIIMSVVDTSIYVIVDELPEEGNPQKIYLVPDGSGNFIEYRWTGTKWDPIGMVEFDLDNYDTKDQVNAKIAAALAEAKTYADGKASTAETNAKTYADTKAGTAETNAKNYADGLASNYDVAGAASTAETNAKNYADTKKTEAISSANSYTDTAIQTSITSVLGGSY